MVLSISSKLRTGPLVVDDVPLNFKRGLRLYWQLLPHRSFRTPPVPGMRSPFSGFRAT